MFQRLKKKWNVSWWQFLLIFTTFALGGSLCARIGNWVLLLVLSEKNVLYWIAYVPLITLLWPVCVLLISIPLGQFRFFSNYLRRIWQKITGKASPRRIALFASGTGTNARVLIEHFEHHPSIHVALVVSNKANAGVLQVASSHHIPSLLLEKDAFFNSNVYAEELKAERIDLIVLAGFLWKLPESLIKAWPKAIVNIHPALLPMYGGKGMYGAHVHEAVLANGDTESGITIHYADELYDHGEIIFQARCKVEAGDTPESLATRIHQLEYEHYKVVVEQVVQNLKGS